MPTQRQAERRVDEPPRHVQHEQQHGQRSRRRRPGLRGRTRRRPSDRPIVIAGQAVVAAGPVAQLARQVLAAICADRDRQHQEREALDSAAGTAPDRPASQRAGADTDRQAEQRVGGAASAPRCRRHRRRRRTSPHGPSVARPAIADDQVERQHEERHRSRCARADAELVGQQRSRAPMPGAARPAARTAQAVARCGAAMHRCGGSLLRRASRPVPAARPAAAPSRRRRTGCPQSDARYLLAVSISAEQRPRPASEPAMLPMPPTATTTSTSTRYLRA